jgi:UDP-N-acetylmuramate: L-alanyl-gamma-D-glutamyl-meso-diaminopimelate ligase
MRIHFIAIGGAAMHSLAIALQQKGNTVTGSDDEIFDPARARLSKAGLLPEQYGWFPERITADLDCVILGMHAHRDNPELNRALEAGVTVYSYPEFLFNQAQRKTRVVIAGSHGKTTITSMIMHVLKAAGVRFDYMVGSGIEGFDNMVSLDEGNSIAIFEGDEYLSSCLDRRPKFHVYKPQIALVSGISWDHINVFPTREEYVDQFRIFMENIPSGGCLVYCDEDAELRTLAVTVHQDILKLPYKAPAYNIEEGLTRLEHDGVKYEMQVFGHHNMQNMQGAKLVCNQLGISDSRFYKAIMNFRGAGKRLQLLGKKDDTCVFLDFAHSPSKVEATVKAVKEQYPGNNVMACLELHTYSSLTRQFLVNYRNTLDAADEAIVFFDPGTVLHKRLEMIAPADIIDAFQRKDLKVFSVKDELETYLLSGNYKNTALLLMSSGNFSGIEFRKLVDEILE